MELKAISSIKNKKRVFHASFLSEGVVFFFFVKALLHKDEMNKVLLHCVLYST